MSNDTWAARFKLYVDVLLVLLRGGDCRGAGRFVAGDFLLKIQKVSYLIHAVEQALLREGIDRKCDPFAVWKRQCLGSQVHFDAQGVVLFKQSKEFLMSVAVDQHRKQPILQAIISEDVGEGGADDCAEAEIDKGPGCVFPGATAAKVIAGEEYAGAGAFRFVQYKLRLWIPLAVVSPIIKKDFGQSFFVGDLQKAGGRDLIGIHIFIGQGDNATAEFADWFHFLFPSEKLAHVGHGAGNS